jgi:hypothetical protein
MHYNCQFFLTCLSVIALLPDITLVSAFKIPFGHSKDSSRNGNTVDVELPDIGFVKTYVCPVKTDLFRRQSNVPPTIAIPKDDLDAFLLQMRLMGVQMISMVDAMLLEDGFAVPSDALSLEALSSTSTSKSISSEVISTLSEFTSMITTALTTTITISTATTLVRTRSASVAALSTTASSQIPLNTEHAAASSTTISFPGNLSTTAQLPISISTAAVAPTIQLSDNNAGYTFDASSSKNVAVYFGQTVATVDTSLEAQCADPNIDIVILAFVVSQLDGGQYPGINFGAACPDLQTETMRNSAPGLLSCPDLAGMVTACQNTYGKKVLLSMGGSNGQISFTSDTQAAAFADVLWDLFGPPGNVDVTLRPFGSVEIDGFDVGSLPLSLLLTPSLGY